MKASTKHIMFLVMTLVITLLITSAVFAGCGAFSSGTKSSDDEINGNHEHVFGDWLVRGGERSDVLSICDCYGTYRVCSICGYEEMNEGDKPLGHNYTNGVCTRCGKIEYLDFEIADDGCVVVGCDSNIKTPNIPREYNGHSVVGIGDSAFKNHDNLTSITIPNSVVHIYDDAFSGCTALESITIPNSVRKIWDRAFWDCSNLRTVNLGNGVTELGYGSFGNCVSLSSIDIPDNVTICYKAFKGCSGLRSITGNAENIFYGIISVCDLDSYSVTLTGQEIMGGIFEYQTGLTSVTIGDDISTIGSWAFSACTGLRSITIPDSVKSIETGAFYACTGLRSITIPDSVTDMASTAFLSCSGLTSITGNANFVSAIASFCDSSSFTVNIVSGDIITERSFEENNGLTAVTIGDSVARIENLAFASCDNLTSVTFGNGVEYVGMGAFSHCTHLKSVIVYNSFDIGYQEFVACDELQYNEYGNGKYLGNENNPYIVFMDITNNNITNLDINENCKQFYGGSSVNICDNLSSIRYMGDVASWCEIRELGRLMSYINNTTNLYIDGEQVRGHLIIPDGVTSIPVSAFRCCKELTSVSIPNSVTKIEFWAFENTGLTSLLIPSSVSNIDNFAFDHCNDLLSINVNENNTTYHGAGNCLIETATGTLILGCKNSVIPTDGSVTKIGFASFSGSGLQSIVLPDSVTYIDGYAFQYCTDLTSVTIPNSVTSIGDDAFYGCIGLTSITIPNSVTSIGAGAFANCTGLTSVTIGNRVTRIGSYAFGHCSGLTSVTFNGTKAQWNAIEKVTLWDSNTGDYVVYCTDGDVAKS